MVLYQRPSFKLAEIEKQGYALYCEQRIGILGYDFFLAYEPKKIIIGQLLTVDSAFAIAHFHYRIQHGAYDEVTT